MNIEHINKLIETLRNTKESTLESDDVGFNMKTFTHSCGTPSCIGGYAVALSKNLTENDNLEAVEIYGYTSTAADYLGLDDDTAGDLFYPFGIGMPWNAITAPMAIEVIENLVKTGKVDWSIVDDVSKD